MKSLVPPAVCVAMVSPSVLFGVAVLAVDPVLLLREHEHLVLAQYPEPLDALEIVADWPEDIAQFCMLLLKGPGTMVQVPQLIFRIVEMPGFSTAANSAVPHNALHDARALRDHIMNHLD